MRIDHPQFDVPVVARVYDALNGEGATARIVGGAVRNAVLGRPITDIDFATTTPPAETTRRAEAAGFKVVPTGVAHGTVLLVADGQTFEVTTLREDIETDGRHAVVRFGTDWRADASRRDFSMNALYRDADGALFDPLEGLADARAGKVRFIGEAAQRIREDGLRILRFYRFSADYGGGTFDPEGLRASRALRDMVEALSGERVCAEFLKILVASHAEPAIRIMQEGGILKHVLSCEPNVDGFGKLVRLPVEDERARDPLVRLASLLVSPFDAKATAARLRLANRDRDRLIAAVEERRRMEAGEGDAWRERLYRVGRTQVLDGLLLAAVNAPDRDARMATYSAVLAADAPVFPLTGRDVVDAGVEPGPAVGRLLGSVEKRWIAEGFPSADRVRVLLGEELSRL